MPAAEPNGFNFSIEHINGHLKTLIDTDPAIKRFALRVYRKSESERTVKIYVQQVILFTRWLGKAPADALRSRLDWEAILNDYIDYLNIERRMASGSVFLAIAAVKKWLEVNGAAEKDGLKGVEMPKVYRTERDRLPTKEELRHILNGANLTDRSMALILVSSGIRIGALVELKFKHVKMDLDCPMITVGTEFSKNRQGYITFMSPEAKVTLQQYVKERELNGEKVSAESYVIAKGRPAGGKMRTGGAAHRWAVLLKKADRAAKTGVSERTRKGGKWYQIHIHTMRKYFKSWASLSGVPSDLVEAFMGHRAGIEQAYFLPDLESANNPEVIKKALEEYRKAIPALTIFSDEEKIKRLEAQVNEQAAALQKEREDEAARQKSFADQMEEARKTMEEMKKALEAMRKRS